MTPEPLPPRHPAFARPVVQREPEPLEPTHKATPWTRRWEEKYRDRWEHRPGKDGWFPVPTPAKRRPDEVRFFLIIAKRAP